MTSSSASPVVAAATPTVTVTASPAGSITTAQTLSVTMGVTSSSGVPAGSVVLSSGSYASFPVSLSSGQAMITVPAGLLAIGADTLTASFTPASAATYNSATGTASVAVAASGAPLPVVTASSTAYSTAAYGSPFRALPLPSGNVLVSVSAATSGPVGLRLFDNGKLLAVANSNRFNTGTANAPVLSVAVPAAASVVQTVATGTFPREITAGSDGLTLYLTDYCSQSLLVISTKVQ